MRGGGVYIKTNTNRDLPYIGVTARLASRVHQHHTDAGSAFCRRYGLKTLEAITREKQLKAWRREWKIALIEESNPGWSDLYDTIA